MNFHYYAKLQNLKRENNSAMLLKMYETTILFIKVTGCLSVQCGCLSVAKDLADPDS